MSSDLVGGLAENQSSVFAFKNVQGGFSLTIC